MVNVTAPAPHRASAGHGSDALPVTALGRLAGHCYDRRRLVLVIWIVAIIAITVVAQMVGTDYKNKFTAGNTPSQQALNILQQRFPSQAGDSADIVFHTATPIADNKAAIDDVLSRVRPMPYVEGVTSPFSAAGRTRSRRTATSPRASAIQHRHRRHPDRRHQERGLGGPG